jgi:nicotinamide-nucleotide amidase
MWRPDVDEEKTATRPSDLQDDASAAAEDLADIVLAAGAKVAVAESLTSGSIAAHLGAAHGSSEWFCGGVVAYIPQVKFDVLGVTPGPVITALCATQMAAGVARLMHADFSVAVTGAGGPGPEEGRRTGTAFIATSSPLGVRVEEHRFEGDPERVVRATASAALTQLLDDIQRSDGGD